MNPSRRSFLGFLPSTFLAARDLRCDLVITGAGTGGCAAAIAACRNGLRVVMTEETEWPGGQLTSQAVPPDEHPWIESFGGTALYRSYRRNVRDYYRRLFPLREEIRNRENFNPGGGSVSRLTHEPRVSLAVLEEMLAPWVGGGQLVLLLRHKPVAADVTGDRIRSVTVRSAGGRQHILEAPLFIDATEQGDLLPLTRTEHVTGFESRRQTGEPSAPEEAQPANIQSFTVCFAIEYIKDLAEPIEKPAEYNFWRDYVPKLKPSWPGKLLDWTMTHPITLKPRPMGFNPVPPYTTVPEGTPNLWLYRRIAAQEHFTPGAYRSDISLINWPQNDYWLGNLHGVSEDEAARHLQRAKQLSLSLLYWMQTEAPRPDGKQGWPGLQLRYDQTGTDDGLAMYPYIRESRRIQAEFTVCEQHVSTEARARLTGKPREELTAERFADSVGTGSYRIDLHPSSGGDNYIDVSSLPFQIPLGSLIPKRVENLLAGGKNPGVTHITNGCYRLHPVEWNIGETAGCLAAHVIKNKLTSRQVRNTPKLLADFQRAIEAQGIELEWPRLTPR